jgi:hypothetical protein
MRRGHRAPQYIRVRLTASGRSEAVRARAMPRRPDGPTYMLQKPSTAALAPKAAGVQGAATLQRTEFSSGDGGLPSRHLSRRPDRQLQHLAQRRQVCIPWSARIRLPEVDAG